MISLCSSGGDGTPDEVVTGMMKRGERLRLATFRQDDERFCQQSAYSERSSERSGRSSQWKAVPL